MLAANIFHWWLGAGLTILGVVSVIALLGGYLAKVVAPQYPGRRRHQRED